MFPENYRTEHLITATKILQNSPKLFSTENVGDGSQRIES